MKARYINPFTDYGFIRIFGLEAGKDPLMDFLNQVLPERDQISELSFPLESRRRELEKMGGNTIGAYCRNRAGEGFSLEFRKGSRQAMSGAAGIFGLFPFYENEFTGSDPRWDFRLRRVYRIALLDFTWEDQREHREIVTYPGLRDQFDQNIHEGLSLIMIEAPRFNKPLEILETRLDKWLFFLNNLDALDSVPAELKEYVFIKAFQLAEIAELNAEEEAVYGESLRRLRIAQAREYAELTNSGTPGEVLMKQDAENRLNPLLAAETQKSRKIALALKSQGFSMEKIAMLLKIAPDEVETLF